MALPRNLDLQALTCFDVLVRERSVSRAAEKLGISQSSASEMLAKLRDRFGDPLLVRGRDGMVPTTRAELLLPQVRAARDQLRRLLDEGQGFDPASAGERFRITTSDYTQLLLMPPLVHALQAQAPHCTVDLLPVHIQHLDAALEAAEIDLAIAYHPQPPPGLRRCPLFTDRHVCIVRRGHPQAGQRLTVAQFAALGHVKVAPSGLSYFSGVVDSALEAQGLTRHVAVQSPQFVLAAHLVSQSDLVLALPSRAAAALAAFLPVETLEIPMPTRLIDVAMYWHERVHHSAPHAWLRDTVRQLFAAAPGTQGQGAAA